MRSKRAQRRGIRWLRGQRGAAILSVLAVILVLAVLSGLVLHLSGKELAFTAFRLLGAQAVYVAEGGAYAARSALMAFMNADPIGVTVVDSSLDGNLLATWYASGAAALQNSFGLFDYLITDGQRFSISATSVTDSVTFHVNWGLPWLRLKLQLPDGDPPENALGTGVYRATIVVTRRTVPHASCAVTDCYIHRLGPDEYEFFYSYTIVSNGRISPQARRQVSLSQNYSVRIRRQNFAQYLRFTHVHTGPTGGALWFARMSNYDGPVHTNGEFRFAFFPKFGTPDPQTPCDPARIQATPLTSASTYAWFFNRGSPVRRQANENVNRGVRRDAPVLPDCTPQNPGDDFNNPPANFTRGVAVVPYPTNPYSQKGVAIGRDPADTSPVTNRQVREAIPELADTDDPIPNGIYVPVRDLNANGASDALEPLAGGLFVQGTLDGLTLSQGGSDNNLAVYTLVQGSQTVTVTVDRVLLTTTVTNSAWSDPQTRTFTGVPKGWQTLSNDNAMIVYVEGGIRSLAGTLEEKEQTTIVASGLIEIANHIRYERPPNPDDPTDNPTNLLGIYSPNSDIRIARTAPNNLIIHAVLMAGNLGDGYNSNIYVHQYNMGSPRGEVRLLGGMIQEYIGPFGVMNAAGDLLSGYGSNHRYDRRMSRGFSPPYFPTTTLFELLPGGQGLAGTRPVWREGAP